MQQMSGRETVKRRNKVERVEFYSLFFRHAFVEVLCGLPPHLFPSLDNVSPIPLLHVPCVLLMILPRDSTGGTLPRSCLQCPTHRAHVIVRTMGVPHRDRM